MNGLLAWLACASSPALPPGPTTEHWLAAPASVAIRFPAEGVSTALPGGIALSLPGRRWGNPSLSVRMALPSEPPVEGKAEGYVFRRALANGATLRYSQEDTTQERASSSVLRGTLELDGQSFAVECWDYQETEDGADASRWCAPWLGTLRRVQPKP